MISCRAVLLLVVAYARSEDDELSCRDSVGCRNGRCHLTSFNDIRLLKQILTNNESPVKCYDPIGDKSFLQLYLQNRQGIEGLEAELDRIEKVAKELESISTKINNGNADFVGFGGAITDLERQADNLETLQLNTSKELLEFNETVNGKEDKLTATDVALKELRTDLKQLERAQILLKVPCEFKINEICYWSKVNGQYSFPQATKVCQSSHSSVANVTSKILYDAIVENVKKKQDSSRIWTGMTVDQETKHVIPAKAFTQWKLHDEPIQGRRYTSFTHIYLQIFRFPSRILKPGMVNVPPSWKMDGVICQVSI